jgi:predicted NodU family carbamoyl transferase
MLNAALGKSYSEEQILLSLLQYKEYLEYSYDQNSDEIVARAIYDQKVI